ncbi:DNA polymerase III subunit delta [Sebaldella sp. S0638]|uniref:DNA polymerase III subunit delta n=1 Tax=Sebaldella sp. S0638 TaxID=2957809 RepID=UPI00209D8B4F|nr:DNA polymerase III subunit delta [Sebaldella sp. S0638]MCP1222954.1 DNA polymerase III subunit delta [Sebaldella sp. S0638]
MFYFICGTESRELKYLEILDDIKKKNPGIQEFVFDVVLKEDDKFFEKLNFNSIFGGKEILVLKRAEKLGNIEEVLALISNVEMDSKYVIVDFQIEGSKKNDKLFALLGEIGKKTETKVIKTEEDEKNLADFVKENLKTDTKETQRLLSLIGENPFKVKNEVEKIKSFLGDEPYDFEKIKNMISVQKEYFIYECVEKTIKGEIFEVMEYLKKTKEYMGFLYSMYGEVETLLKLLELEEEGFRLRGDYNSFKSEYEKIKKYFYVNKRPAHPYAIFNKYKNIKRFSRKKLRRLSYKCWEIEKDIKTGKLPMDIGVEALVLEVNR